jgi:hypothetical protein
MTQCLPVEASDRATPKTNIATTKKHQPTNLTRVASDRTGVRRPKARNHIGNAPLTRTPACARVLRRTEPQSV